MFNEQQFIEFIKTSCNYEFGKSVTAQSSLPMTKTVFTESQVQNLQMNNLQMNKTPLLAVSPGSSDRYSQLWVDKYKPKVSADLVGNPSAITVLKDWLTNWHSINITQD